MNGTGGGRDVKPVTGCDADDLAGLASNAALVAIAMADVTQSDVHSQIPTLIEQWVATERLLTGLNLKDCNDGLDADEEVERERVETDFGETLSRFLVKTRAVPAKGFKVEYAREPRGCAIRLFWDGCPSNGLGGGLIIPVA